MTIWEKIEQSGRRAEEELIQELDLYAMGDRYGQYLCFSRVLWLEPGERGFDLGDGEPQVTFNHFN